MRLLKYALVVALFPVLWAQSPQIPVTGTLGAGGVFPLVNSPSVVFATDANHAMTYPEMSGSSGFILVTSSTALTTTRQLIAPLVKGFSWAIENATIGGSAIQVIGATGTGVTIANGYTLTVYCDGTNYVTLPSASGGTVLGVTGTAPVSCTGGANVTCAMAQVTSSVDGYLSHTDWSTFNNKQAALGYTPAHSGANSDITSLSGLTTPLSTAQGGTGGAGGTGYAYGNGSSPFSYSTTIPSSSLTIPMSCQPGLGDGLNAIPAGTYLQTTCRNETGQVWTLTVIRCVADSGSSTCNVTDSEGDPLLTGAITGTSTYASGTIGETTIIGAGDYLEITFVTDGTTKQIGIDVAGTF
jgi:hypothetical protein